MSKRKRKPLAKPRPVPKAVPEHEKMSKTVRERIPEKVKVGTKVRLAFQGRLKEYFVKEMDGSVGFWCEDSDGWGCYRSVRKEKKEKPKQEARQ